VAPWAAWLPKEINMNKSKHDDKWLRYDDDGRNEPGVKARITRRFIEILGGFMNAIKVLHKCGRDGQ